MKKIGEIKGIPVVEGNVNEVTRNQIHYKEEGGGIQLSKRGNDNKLNSVTGSSSSGDGGVKEYYYSVSNETPAEMRGMFPFLLNMVLVSSVLISDNQDDFTNYYKVTNAVNRDGTGAALNVYYNVLRAFSYLDNDTYLTLDTNNKPVKLSGNIFDKTLQYAGAEAEVILPMIESYLQEITKEEYESMITYKPE